MYIKDKYLGKTAAHRKIAIDIQGLKDNGKKSAPKKLKDPDKGGRGK